MGVLPLLALLAAAPPVATAAPADPVAALHGLVVDNIRHCPKAVPGETVVCSRDRGYAESYRLPKSDPRFEKPAAPPVDALAGVGAIGPNACTTIGAVGANGCTLKDYDAWRVWQRQQKMAPPPR